MKIYIVPHTEATHHVDNRVGGWFDSELTEFGRAQAAAVAEALSAQVPTGVPIYSSDLKRAHQTAEAISKRLDAPITLERDLRELSCGVAEGKPDTWLDERLIFPPDDASRLDHQIIEGAESRRSVMQRLSRFVDKLIHQSPERVVVVSHGFATSFFIAAWVGMPVEAAAYVEFDVLPGSISTLVQEPPWNNRTVVTLNDASHLAQLRRQ